MKTFIFLASVVGAILLEGALVLFMLLNPLAVLLAIIEFVAWVWLMQFRDWLAEQQRTILAKGRARQ